MTSKLPAPLAGLVLGALAFTLAGCGSKGGGTGPKGDNTTTGAPSGTTVPGQTTGAPTTTHATGPIDCPADQVRAHCTSCWYDSGTGATSCRACSAPYSLDSTGTGLCTVSCESYVPIVSDKPSMPTNPLLHNGIQWPDTCFDDSDAHFFTIGDWGGLCTYNTPNLCQPGVAGYQHVDAGTGVMHTSLPGQPFPMNNRAEPTQAILYPVDFQAQQLVATQMMQKAQELIQANTPARFVINVGDNFYPGGIDIHCGAAAGEASFTQSQFQQIFEQQYNISILGNIEWWGVLGNHDYGGVCFFKGWDQQIFYTWKPNGRWVMPAQYWMRRVQFKTFSMDFFFLDSNILDSKDPSVDPNHNICNQVHNQPPYQYCAPTDYPPAPGEADNSCGTSAPDLSGPDGCLAWFQHNWQAQYTWFLNAVQESKADYQVVVTHYPAKFNPGLAPTSFLDWATVASEYGIDFIITGHEHAQKVYYKTEPLGDTAWVITGGGGGITSEEQPNTDGHDDSYGFMDIEINVHNFKITAISHGGVVRNVTVALPVEPLQDRAANIEIV